ncbi:MAG: GNAT family N-acetyltransferase [Rhizomicrobium sp.]
MAVEIKLLLTGDEDVFAHVANDVFDNPVDPALAREFLADPHHHIAVAVDDGIVVAFASGVDYIHPDKPRELFVNEVATAPSRRGQGIGKKVVTALLDHGRAIGCVVAWVLTDRDNKAARALYESCGAELQPGNTLHYEFLILPRE